MTLSHSSEAAFTVRGVWEAFLRAVMNWAVVRAGDEETWEAPTRDTKSPMLQGGAKMSEATAFMSAAYGSSSMAGGFLSNEPD